MSSTQSVSRVDVPRRALVAGTIGHALEWFDFVLFAIMATILANVFFPPDQAANGLLLTLTIYAMGYGARLLGGFVLGAMGDRWGRTNTLALIITVMSAATLATGLLPTYAQVGVWAPILLAITRFIQGFASGGEFGSSTAMMVEHAPPGRRGFFGSWQQWGVLLSILIGSVTLNILTNVMSESELYTWGWRVPFIVAAVLGLFGLYLRLKVPEPEEFEEMKEAGETSSTPLRDTVRASPKNFVLAVLFMAFWTSAGATAYAYAPTFAKASAGMELSQITIGLTVVLLIMIVLFPVVGWMSDKVGFKRLLVAGTVAFALLTIPAYWLMLQGTALTFMIGIALMAICHTLTSAVTPSYFAELFPTNVRSTGLAQAFNIGVVVFGANTPLALTFLIEKTQYPLVAPITVAVFAVLILFGVTLRLPAVGGGQAAVVDDRVRQVGGA